MLAQGYKAGKDTIMKIVITYSKNEVSAFTNTSRELMNMSDELLSVQEARESNYANARKTAEMQLDKIEAGEYSYEDIHDNVKIKANCNETSLEMSEEAMVKIISATAAVIRPFMSVIKLAKSAFGLLKTAANEAASIAKDLVIDISDKTYGYTVGYFGKDEDGNDKKVVIFVKKVDDHYEEDHCIYTNTITDGEEDEMVKTVRETFNNNGCIPSNFCGETRYNEMIRACDLDNI